MKAIFLDIDGVANSAASVFAKIGPNIATSEAVRQLSADNGGLDYAVTYALKCVNPVSVALINLLTEQSGAGIVLSSTHRKYFSDASAPYGSHAHLFRLREYLRAMGFFVPVGFDITPELHRPRGDEVDAWIDEHGEPEAFVILDDGRDFKAHQPLVWCDPDSGFSFKNFVEASQFLGIKQSAILL